MTSYTDKELASEARRALKEIATRESYQYTSPDGRARTARIIYAGFSLLMSGSSYTLQARGKWNDSGTTIKLNIAI